MRPIPRSASAVSRSCAPCARDPRRGDGARRPRPGSAHQGRGAPAALARDSRRRRGRFLLLDAGHEPRPRLRHALLHADRLAVDRGLALGGCPVGARHGRGPVAPHRGLGDPARPGVHLRRRRRQPHRPRTVRRGRGLPRLPLARVPLARVPPLPAEELTPEPIALAIVFEDEHVLVVDKPAGMVTHPGAGQAAGTLAAAALAHAPTMAGVGGPRRPGIVHRLDKGTSGLIVLAKSRHAYDSLTAQLQRRTMSRRYLCLAHGAMAQQEGMIDAAIARDPRSRVRMAVARAGTDGRAVTRIRVLEAFAGY